MLMEDIKNKKQIDAIIRNDIDISKFNSKEELSKYLSNVSKKKYYQKNKERFKEYYNQNSNAIKEKLKEQRKQKKEEKKNIKEQQKKKYTESESKTSIEPQPILVFI
jgi:deoxyxylulose-5-phosphate synthase